MDDDIFRQLFSPPHACDCHSVAEQDEYAVCADKRHCDKGTRTIRCRACLISGRLVHVDLSKDKH